MNALWFERLYTYRNSSYALESAKKILELKDTRRAHLLHRYRRPTYVASYEDCASIEAALLVEARNAKNFWREYNDLLPLWTRPFSCRPRSPDPCNKLLDVGYHHLAQMVEKIISDKEISAAVGLIHRAHRVDAKPLIYDLMELFRADAVDFALLRYLRLKKKPVENVEAHISHFLHTIISTGCGSVDIICAILVNVIVMAIIWNCR